MRLNIFLLALDCLVCKLNFDWSIRHISVMCVSVLWFCLVLYTQYSLKRIMIASNENYRTHVEVLYCNIGRNQLIIASKASHCLFSPPMHKSWKGWSMLIWEKLREIIKKVFARQQQVGGRQHTSATLTFPRPRVYQLASGSVCSVHYLFSINRTVWCQTVRTVWISFIIIRVSLNYIECYSNVRITRSWNCLS